MLVYAEKLIGLRTEMMAEVGDRSAMRGVLRLGVAETIVHTWLPRLIKRVNTVLSKPVAGDRGRHHAEPALRACSRRRSSSPSRSGRPRHPSVRNRVLCDYPVGFVASPALGLGDRPLTVEQIARFPIITFPRKTQPYERVRALFNRPDLPPIRLHASASLATVIHMAIEGLGVAVIPAAIVENELAIGPLAGIEDRSAAPAADTSAQAGWRRRRWWRSSASPSSRPGRRRVQTRRLTPRCRRAMQTMPNTRK